jgi:hypothetical protein
MPIELAKQALEARTRQFVSEPHDPCDAKLLARIQQGLIDSKQNRRVSRQAAKALGPQVGGASGTEGTFVS